MNTTYSEHELRERIKAAGARWVAQQQFWLFGTARYYDGTTINRHTAERDCRHYFNTIDRQLLSRRDYNANRRLHRLVFIETGKTRTNTHVHFFIKGTNLAQYRHIKAACETNWRQHISAASDCVVLDNITLAHERSGYCWKEYSSLHSETLYAQCCHLPHSRT